MKLVPVIGLETHVQLKTISKIFCGCSTVFGAPPNSQVCPICLGFPGTLPVLNRQVLMHGMKVALALNCRIQSQIIFHRKNYFYPDLPKGYQISQYDAPLGADGFVELTSRKIRVCRAHMEEDAGKLIHKDSESASLIDFNRCGMPLLEIVTEPDLTSPEEAYNYLKVLKGILGYLDVSDCDMEKGSLRCDANISLSPENHGGDPSLLGTKVEMKNLNSFKAVSRSLAYEIVRQTEVLTSGEKVQQETRLWDDVRGVTQGMRSKEFAHDYRYFPEPDLVPFSVSSEEIQKVKISLPELPNQRADRFIKQYGVPKMDAASLTASREMADYFEKAVKMVPGTTIKSLANWILSDLSRELNERNTGRINDLKFPPEWLVALVNGIDSGQISGKMAKEVFVESIQSGRSPEEIVRSKGLVQVTDRSALREVAESVIQEHVQAARDFQNGKEQSLMFLVGQLMRKTKGAASPAVSQEILRELLKRSPSG